LIIDIDVGAHGEILMCIYSRSIHINDVCVYFAGLFAPLP
jgi:hypothetical protein